MTQKTALILSAVLTAFLLVLGGAIAAQVSQSAAAPATASTTASTAASTAAPTAAPAVSAPVTDVTAQLQEIMQQREAQYRKLIDQANQRLATLNQQLSTAQETQAAPAPAAAARAATTVRAEQPAPLTIAVSAETARNIAINASNFATMIREPELVRFEGKVAYEVGFTRGVIYVDANTGAVLYNGTQRGGGGQATSQSSAHENEHETEVEHETESHD